MIRIYIASPYTIGNPDDNVLLQIKISNDLINEGFAPFIPLLYHYIDKYYSHSYQTWLNLCFEWVKQCDCLLRLGGESNGADAEVKLAESLNIPVFYSTEDLYKHYKNINKK